MITKHGGILDMDKRRRAQAFSKHMARAAESVRIADEIRRGKLLPEVLAVFTPDAVGAALGAIYKRSEVQQMLTALRGAADDLKGGI